MTAIEKKICETVLKDGEVKENTSCVSGEGIEIESYIVEYLGEKYTMTKNNGEWVYFFHHTGR